MRKIGIMGVIGILGVLMLASSFVADSASAETFAQKHPRRAEVNRRERRQQNRLARKVANGQMSAQQAQNIESNEAGIKAQERAEVKANGGHLTQGQKQQLNQELNQQSQSIQGH